MTKIYDLKKLKKPYKIYKNDQGKIVKETFFINFLFEAIILSQVVHPNIVKVLQICENLDDEQAMILMEFGSKERIVNWYPEQGIYKISQLCFNDKQDYVSKLKQMFWEMASAVSYRIFISTHSRNLPL